MLSISNVIISNAKLKGLELDNTNFNAVSFILAKGFVKSLGKDIFEDNAVEVKDSANGITLTLNSNEVLNILITKSRIEVNGNCFDIKIDVSERSLFGKHTIDDSFDKIEDYYILEEDTFRLARRVNEETEFHASATYSGLFSPEIGLYSLKQEYPQVKSKGILKSIKNFYKSYTVVPYTGYVKTQETFAELNDALLRKVNKNEVKRRVLK